MKTQRFLLLNFDFRRRPLITVAQREPPSYAEVEHLNPALRRQHDVFRLDVTVENPLLMRGVQAFKSLSRQFEKFLGSEALMAQHDGPQRRAFDVFHDEEDLTLFLNDVVNAGYVRVIQCRRLLCLSKKSATVTLVLLQPRSHALDRYHTFKFRVLCLIDLPHAADAQELENDEAPSNCACQCRCARGRGSRFGCLHSLARKSVAILLRFAPQRGFEMGLFLAMPVGFFHLVFRRLIFLAPTPSCLLDPKFVV